MALNLLQFLVSDCSITWTLLRCVVPAMKIAGLIDFYVAEIASFSYVKLENCKRLSIDDGLI